MVEICTLMCNMQLNINNVYRKGVRVYRFCVHSLKMTDV